MARIRTIKPNFFTSADIVERSPLARLLYVATWLEADREGRLPWRPSTLKLRYFPGDSCDINALCAELVDAGLVVPYEVEGERFAEIPTFKLHQVINNRESGSVIPARAVNAKPTRAPRVPHASGTPLVGREGKGKEGKEGESHASPSAPPPSGRSQKGTRLPDDWTPDAADTLLAEASGLTGGRAATELAKFRDYWRAQPGQKGVKADWSATWRNWVRRAVEDARGGGRHMASNPMRADDTDNTFEEAAP